jgi:hypothetical protein
VITCARRETYDTIVKAGHAVGFVITYDPDVTGLAFSSDDRYPSNATYAWNPQVCFRHAAEMIVNETW